VIMGRNSWRCNLCGGTRFTDFRSRKNVQCGSCESVERTRLLWMYLERLTFTSETRVLHMAPERSLYNALKKRIQPANYVCADLNPDAYGFVGNMSRLDLCNLDDQPSDRYDVIIHSHVLEHVPCNIAYILFHLHRMLKSEGHHVCVIPFLSGCYDECFQPIGPDECKRRFGQANHVRRFGVEDIDRHLGALLQLPGEFNAREQFGAGPLRRANIPESAWRGFTVNTVLVLRKYDMKLLLQP
jgi:hypothetical protein